MSWKDDLDTLVASAMAFAKDVKRAPASISPAASISPVVLTTAEQTLAASPKPVRPAALIMPVVVSTSERDEIRLRVNNFKAHQEKMARQREDFYLQMRAKMIAPVDPNVNPS